MLLRTGSWLTRASPETFALHFPYKVTKGIKAALIQTNFVHAINQAEELQDKDHNEKCINYLCECGVLVNLPTEDPNLGKEANVQSIMIALPQVPPPLGGHIVMKSR